MSTGENLMISIVNSIDIRNKDRASLSKPCLMFLDEIELALHPSSLKRFVVFLTEISNTYNYAIYFSTHSIELISGIRPDNIFFIERYADAYIGKCSVERISSLLELLPYG
jgi:predicted ATPase